MAPTGGESLLPRGLTLLGHTPGLFFARPLPNRAILFIDGNNWYHGVKSLGVTDQGRLSFSKISTKLVGPRDWVATRYYIGRVPQGGDVRLYADQRHFLAKLESHPHITTHLGRLERRRRVNKATQELRSYLANLNTRIDFKIFQDLMKLAKEHQDTTVMVEKAVDVMLAVDLVVMAERDEFDAAYLLSADGDYTPAVEHVRALGKRVYAVSAAKGAKLASAVDSFIRLPAGWFNDCWEAE